MILHSAFHHMSKSAKETGTIIKVRERSDEGQMSKNKKLSCQMAEHNSYPTTEANIKFIKYLNFLLICARMVYFHLFTLNIESE